LQRYWCVFGGSKSRLQSRLGVSLTKKIEKSQPQVALGGSLYCANWRTVFFWALHTEKVGTGLRCAEDKLEEVWK